MVLTYLKNGSNNNRTEICLPVSTTLSSLKLHIMSVYWRGMENVTGLMKKTAIFDHPFTLYSFQILIKIQHLST